MLAIAMYIPGSDPESRLLRKTLMQNCNLMAVLVFRSISESVRYRLKTLEDVVTAGIGIPPVTFHLHIISNDSIINLQLWQRFHDSCRTGNFQGCRIGCELVLATWTLVRSSIARSSKSGSHYWPIWCSAYHEGRLLEIHEPESIFRNLISVDGYRNFWSSVPSVELYGVMTGYPFR